MKAVLMSPFSCVCWITWATASFVPLDEAVWQALCQLLRKPEVIPQLHQTWAEAKQQNISSLAAQQSQLLQRRQWIERQDQRLLDAYQAEAINLVT
jgi:hypothetical protein